MNTIGTNIAEFRKQTGMTQEELSVKLNVTSQAVSKWENDLSYPDITVMERLAEVLDVTVDMLLKGREALPVVKTAEREEIDRRILLVEVTAEKVCTKIRVPVKLFDRGILDSLLSDEEVLLGVETMRELIDGGMLGVIVEHEDEHNKIRVSVIDYED